MERENSSLACRVVCETSNPDKTCCTGNGHNVAFVLLQHIRQERLNSIPIAQHIYIENLPKKVVVGAQYSMRSQDSRVVDKNTGLTQSRLDFLCCRVDRSGTGDVTREELDVCICRSRSVSSQILRESLLTSL